MDKEKLEIEEAFELVKDTNFQLFVDRLARYQTVESLKYEFGNQNIEVPDINRIYTEYNRHQTETKAYIDDFVNFPDAKLRLQNHISTIARLLMFNKESLYKIRQGETVWLNMELIGQLWSHSNTLIKYRDKLHNFKKLNTRPLPTLEDIFKDKKQLKKLVDLLIEKGFVERKETGSLHWTGKAQLQANGKAKQLIALTEVCKDKNLYKKTTYLQNELHHAWTTYFNFQISPNMFTEYKRPPKGSQYHDLYKNLLTSI